MTYDPFHGLEFLPLPGPVFIHAEPCERFGETAGFPEDLRDHRLTVMAYGKSRRLLVEEHVDNGQVEPLVESPLNKAEVQYLHVRDTDAGCYDFRIERF